LIHGKLVIVVENIFGLNAKKKTIMEVITYHVKNFQMEIDVHIVVIFKEKFMYWIV